jgi:4'-phosphopantetheinyl transferase
MPEPGHAHLFLIRVPGDGQPIAPLLARLTPAERERATAKRIESKRREYITGQASLRTLLGRMLGTNPPDVAYRRGVKGKPYLSDEFASSDLQFNITHSGGVVVVAMAVGTEVGVDVEWHNERTNPDLVARRAFTPAEREGMAGVPADDRRAHFFQIWTCKEALVKCTGLGIHSGMDQYEVSLVPNCSHAPGARVAAAWGKQAGVEQLQVVPLPLGVGHAGALVHEPPALTTHLWRLEDTPDPLAGV